MAAFYHSLPILATNKTKASSDHNGLPLWDGKQSISKFVLGPDRVVPSGLVSRRDEIVCFSARVKKTDESSAVSIAHLAAHVLDGPFVYVLCMVGL